MDRDEAMFLPCEVLLPAATENVITSANAVRLRCRILCEGANGPTTPLADEILRGRFRRSFAKPEPIPANQVIEYEIDLHTNNHAFLKGHRIMVQIQSSWFPLYDRNPQTFVNNIFLARDSDYKPAAQRIFRSGSHPSHITIPVLTSPQKE